jgi:O-methyltransferase involved in polyketide biosynthesis
MLFIIIILQKDKGRISSVGMALGCGLDDRGYRVRFPTGAGNFSLHH